MPRRRLQTSVPWNSTLDVVYFNQGADSGGVISFSETGLSGGAHTITATATDEDGLSAVQSVGVTINWTTNKAIDWHCSGPCQI